MSTSVHGSAVVHPGARIGENVTIGPFCLVEDGVVVGDNVSLISGVVLAAGSTIGRDCVIHHGTVIGTAPQDLKFKGEQTGITIGERTTIREFCTLNRGTLATGMTRVGADCLLMAYTHVAHDCQIGDHVITANVTQMGGHVHIDDWAIIGGKVGIHQFSHVGAHAMVGASTYVSKDVPPYVLVGGNPLAFSGINVIGLRRRGFTDDAIESLRAVYRLMYRSGLNVSDGLAKAEKELAGRPEVANVIAFVRGSARGIVRGR